MSDITTKHYIVNYNDITNIPFVDIDNEKLQVVNNKLTTIYADTNLRQGQNINISSDGYINVRNTFINDTDINKIYYNGNVGIGTSNPESLLNIYDSINNSNLLNINNLGISLETNINIFKNNIQIGSDTNKVDKIYCNYINDIDTSFLTEDNLKNNIFYTRNSIDGIARALTTEITSTSTTDRGYTTEMFANSSNYTENKFLEVITSSTQNLNTLNNSSNYSDELFTNSSNYADVLFSNSSNYAEELFTNSSNYVNNEISKVSGDVINNAFDTNIRTDLPELIITEEITSLRSETKSAANIIGNYNDTSGIILTANNSDNYKSFIILKSVNSSSSSSVKIYNYDDDNLLISTNDNDITAPTVILNKRKMILGYNTSEYFTSLYDRTNTLEIKGDININGNLKKNNEIINLNVWSTQSNNVNYIGNIIYKDNSPLTNAAYTNGSLVTIAGDFSSKQGLIIEKYDRTGRIGITDSSIQQLGGAINDNLSLSIKSKGSKPVTIGNETNDTLQVYENRALLIGDLVTMGNIYFQSTTSDNELIFDGTYGSLSGLPTLSSVATSGSYADLTDEPLVDDSRALRTRDGAFRIYNENSTNSQATLYLSYRDNNNYIGKASGSVLTSIRFQGNEFIEGTDVNNNNLADHINFMKDWAKIECRVSDVYDPSDQKVNGDLVFNLAYNTSYQSINNYDRVIFKANGRVGIGTTDPKTMLNIASSNPACRLVADTNCNSFIELVEGGSDKNSFTYGGRLMYDGTANRLKLQMANDNTIVEALSIVRSNGYVGFGHDGATARIDVSGEIKARGTDNDTHINHSTSDEDTYIRGGKTASKVVISDLSGDVAINHNNPNYPLDIVGTTYIRDYLLIGTPSGYNPVYKLDVDGDIHFTGDLIKTINVITDDPVIVPTISINNNVSFKTIVFENTGDEQTIYDVNFSNNTVCDILLIGGGGAGGYTRLARGGGGGAGSCIVYKNYIMNGNYKIKVGKGGLKGSATSNNDHHEMREGDNGNDSEITNQEETIVFFKAKGGGRGGTRRQEGHKGGCGGGAGGDFNTGELEKIGGNYSSDNIVAEQLNIPPSSTSDYVVYGNIGGRNTYSSGDDYITDDGGGGGGIGEGGTTTGNINAVDAQEFDGGKGGDGLYKATIDNIDYNFKTYFDLTGKLENDGYYYIGGGGGGGDYSGAQYAETYGNGGVGGKGGGGDGGDYWHAGVDAVSYGSGGGGAGRDTFHYMPGNGSSGVVVIRYSYYSSIEKIIEDTTVLVTDTTPQLGGNLDVNEKDIISTIDKNINIDPAGNGDFVIKGNTTRGSGSIKLNCENNSHGIKIKGPPHSASASYTLTLPDNVGTANQLLSTDGSGNLSFITPAASYSDSDVTALLNNGNIGISIASGCHAGAMVIDSNGLVELNTNSNSTNISTYKLLDVGGTGAGSTMSTALSLRTNYGINIQGGYALIVSSSRKIKKEETELEDGECLQICMGLKPKKYKMIDDRLHGNDYRYGFIAEELEEVLPSAVQSHEQLIPNIYDMATIINNNTIEITKDLEIDVEYTIYNSNEDDKVETKYKMNVLEILGNNLYRVDLDMSTMYGGSIFIYGKIDNDVKQLKKDNLFPILTSSVQELHTMIQNQQTQINQLLEILSRNGIS